MLFIFSFPHFFLNELFELDFLVDPILPLHIVVVKRSNMMGSFFSNPLFAGLLLLLLFNFSQHLREYFILLSFVEELLLILPFVVLKLVRFAGESEGKGIGVEQKIHK